MYDSVITPSRSHIDYSYALKGNGVGRASRGHGAVISSQYDAAAT